MAISVLGHSTLFPVCRSVWSGGTIRIGLSRIPRVPVRPEADRQGFCNPLQTSVGNSVLIRTEEYECAGILHSDPGSLQLAGDIRIFGPRIENYPSWLGCNDIFHQSSENAGSDIDRDGIQLAGTGCQVLITTSAVYFVVKWIDWQNFVTMFRQSQHGPVCKSIRIISGTKYRNCFCHWPLYLSFNQLNQHIHWRGYARTLCSLI